MSASNEEASATTVQSATITEQQTAGGGGEGSQKEGLEGGDISPNTAHAVLDEGSLECLTLSKRGLYAAGKVSPFTANVHVHASSICSYRMVKYTALAYRLSCKY